MPGHADPAFDTLAIHAGAQPDPATGARAVPIHLSSSFVFGSSDHPVALIPVLASGSGGNEQRFVAHHLQAGTGVSAPSSSSRRSRAVIRPRACWRATLSSPPPR